MEKFRDGYLFKGTLSVANTAVENVNPDNTGKKVIFKNYASFNDGISEKNNTQVDNARDINVVMALYKLTGIL